MPCDCPDGWTGSASAVLPLDRVRTFRPIANATEEPNRGHQDSWLGGLGADPSSAPSPFGVIVGSVRPAVTSRFFLAVGRNRALPARNCAAVGRCERGVRFGMLIDAPVGPASPRAEIEAWIATLDRMARRDRYAGDPSALDAIASARLEALDWLTPLSDATEA
jgi:hypothetical protein